MNLKNTSLRLFEENRQLNAREIAERKVVLSSRVTSLVVTLTTRCNIRCVMCEEHSIPWDMPRRTLDEIMRLFPYLEHILWQGGEILATDDFVNELLPEANRHPQLHQAIITNALAITPQSAEKLVSDNIELTISIDGATKESYESIRRGGSFERLLGNIRMINELRRRRQAKNMTMRMHAVILRSNYRTIDRFVDFAHEQGFDALHLMPVWGNFENGENIFHQQDRESLRFLHEARPRVEERARELSLALLNSLPLPADDTAGRPAGTPADDGPEPAIRIEKDGQSQGAAEPFLCHMPWKRMVINPAGYVCPACHCRAMIGNVLENSLEELWNGEQMVRYRERIVNGTARGSCNPSCIDGSIAPELRGLR
jgi:MoaA/NifB/PqqE/SkfB family radical SAM enzyme